MVDPAQSVSPPSGPAAPLQGGVLEQPPTPPPSGPAAPLKGGILEQLEQGNLEIGFSERQPQQPPADQGAADLPQATEGSEPAAVEEEPEPLCPEGQVLDENSGFCLPEDCPEGQVLDEETGLCVLEEPEAQESEEPEQPASEDSGTEEEQGQ
jgi:hypothetical protein